MPIEKIKSGSLMCTLNENRFTYLKEKNKQTENGFSSACTRAQAELGSLCCAFLAISYVLAMRGSN